MMINVYCRTNLDDYQREEWPEVMVCLPRIGDRVVAKSGNSLRVVGITHSVYTENNWLKRDKIGQPYVIVELHKEHI